MVRLLLSLHREHDEKLLDIPLPGRTGDDSVPRSKHFVGERFAMSLKIWGNGITVMKCDAMFSYASAYKYSVVWLSWYKYRKGLEFFSRWVLPGIGTQQKMFISLCMWFDDQVAIRLLLNEWWFLLWLNASMLIIPRISRSYSNAFDLYPAWRICF